MSILESRCGHSTELAQTVIRKIGRTKRDSVPLFHVIIGNMCVKFHKSTLKSALSLTPISNSTSLLVQSYDISPLSRINGKLFRKLEYNFSSSKKTNIKTSIEPQIMEMWSVTNHAFIRSIPFLILLNFHSFVMWKYFSTTYFHSIENLIYFIRNLTNVHVYVFYKICIIKWLYVCT